MYSGSFKKNIPRIIHEWAYDIAGEEERVLPIIKQLLQHMDDVTSLWKENKAFQELNYARHLSFASCNTFGSMDKFHQLIQGPEYNELLKSLLSQGKNPTEARKSVIRYFAILADLDIHKPQAFEAFYKELNHLIWVQSSLEWIKTQIVLEHFEKVYQKCRLINLIRLQNGVYHNTIGESLALDSILGERGSKLQAKDANALDYIFGLEQEETELDNRKMVIEFNQEERKGRC